MAELTRQVRARVVRFCATPPRLLVAWWAREDEPFARQAELDAMLDGVVAPLIAELTRADRELAALGGPALCERAMTAVAPALLEAAQPVDEARRAAWKKWKRVDVAKFYADACKAEKVFTTSLEALQCYARIEGGLQHTLDAMDSCDELEQPIDAWLRAVDERFELVLQKKR
jgi:hypothetical protein